MKTSHLLMLALLGLGLAGAGCGNPGNVVPHNTKTQPTGPMDLRLNWPLHRHGIQSFDMKITQEMTVPGMPQPMTQVMTMGQDTSLTVTKELPGGGREVEMQYLRTKMGMAMAGKTMLDYDSAKKSPKDGDATATAFANMVGAKIQFILDAGDKVESVQGVEDLQNRMASLTKNDPSGTMKAMFNADALKQMMDQAANLPGKAVKPGDSWPVHHEYPMGAMGTMVSDFTFTLNGWELRHGRWCARIAMEGTLSTRPGDDAAQADSPMKGMKITVTDGTASGETWFDEDMGMFTDTTLNLDMKLAITIPMPNMAKGKKAGNKAAAPTSQTINSDMHQVVKTQFELK
jgi:hypothetical protein